MTYGRSTPPRQFPTLHRMSSGCYFLPLVRMVEIPKPGGKGVRVLGVSSVEGRIAQTVAAMVLESGVEKIFHPDSYGYRPGKSALDAVGVCRERCWQTDWVIDLDIKGFFDNLDHDLVLKVVAHHTDQKWILLYVQRWLTAPLQKRDGTLVARDRGSPQGSLCEASHNDPYEQRWVMCSAGPLPLVRRAAAVERCA